MAGFLLTLVTAIAVQLAWPLTGLSGHRDKS